MPRYLKLPLVISLIIISGLLFSPVISLILSEKLTNRTYYRLLYHVIVDKETAACHDDGCKAAHLFQYVVERQFPQGTPYECKPAESLIYGEAYCDFQAKTLNALLGIAGIPSRYAMLLDKDGISPHTLNEVFLGKQWCVFDPSTNIIFEDSKGNKVSLEQMSNNPELIYNTRKIMALKEYDKNEYNNFVLWFSRMFPLTAEPRRSTPTLFQSHLFDYITDVYFKIFRYNFFNFYQDLYLKFKKSYCGEKDFRLFFMARNYHLAYRRDLALRYYNDLLREYPQSKYIEDTIFFCGIVYFEKKNISQAIELFKNILDKHSPRWRSASYYYLGRSYDLSGNKEESIKAYQNAGIFKLSTQVLEELNEYKRHPIMRRNRMSDYND
jgi:hypothetical protein